MKIIPRFYLLIIFMSSSNRLMLKIKSLYKYCQLFVKYTYKDELFLKTFIRFVFSLVLDFMLRPFFRKLFEPFYKMVNGNKNNQHPSKYSFLEVFFLVLNSNDLLLLSSNQLIFFHQQLDIMNLNLMEYLYVD